MADRVQRAMRLHAEDDHRHGGLTVLVALGMAVWCIAGARADSPGNPASVSTAADVQVMDLITINQDANLHFGKIIPPTSGLQTFTVGLDDSIVAGPGTGAPAGGHHRGQYDVLGTDGQPVTFTTSFNGCTHGNLGITALTHNAGPPFVLDEIDFFVGGTLTVVSPVPPGNYTCVYSLAAHY